jgi:hypothetical protein
LKPLFYGWLSKTVRSIDKRYGQKIELVRRQYSGTGHRILPGRGLINCVYINKETGHLWVIDYRIYDPAGDGKSKLQHVADMLDDLVNCKQLAFSKVLMDSWYASQKLMAHIDGLGTERVTKMATIQF